MYLQIHLDHADKVFFTLIRARSTVLKNESEILNSSQNFSYLVLSPTLLQVFSHLRSMANIIIYLASDAVYRVDF